MEMKWVLKWFRLLCLSRNRLRCRSISVQDPSVVYALLSLFISIRRFQFRNELVSLCVLPCAKFYWSAVIDRKSRCNPVKMLVKEKRKEQTLSIGMCGGRHRWHINDEFYQVGEEYEQRVISSAHFIHVSNAVLPRKHTVLHTTAGHDVESFFIFPFSTRIAFRLFCEKNGNKRLDSIWNGSTDCIQILFICVAKSHGTDRLCKYKNEYGKRTYSLSLSLNRNPLRLS